MPTALGEMSFLASPNSSGTHLFFYFKKTYNTLEIDFRCTLFPITNCVDIGVEVGRKGTE